MIVERHEAFSAARRTVRVLVEIPPRNDLVGQLADELRLGNLDSRRDWGYAGDYVKAMWLMLQQDEPDDYVIATNETHSVKEFVQLAFSHVDLDWKDYVVLDENLYRPSETHLLMGDYSKGNKELGWEPTVKFHELVKMMVESDLKKVK